MTARAEPEDQRKGVRADASDSRISGASLDLPGRLALRPKEAAAALGLSERTLRAILPAIPHVRLAGAILIPVEELRQWLAERAATQATRAERTAAEILEAIDAASK